MKNLFFLLFAFLIFACGETPSTTDADAAKGMAEFADKADFKKEHEFPVDLDSYEVKGTSLEFPISGTAPSKLYSLRPEASSNKYLFVIHEWWGLNKNIKREADRLFEELGKSVNVVALDLYDGNVATDREQAGAFMKAVKEERAEAIIKGAIDLVTTDANRHGKQTPEITTIGWCFGGGWSLKTSILAGDKAAGCVMYYGMPVDNAKTLAPLKSDVIFIHPKKDQWINEEVVKNFENLAKATGKNLKVHQFDADHAFANPSSPRYDGEAAKEANALTLAFLKEKLSL